MCGIAGIIDFDGRPVTRELLERMCRAISHRGPDDQGILRLEPGEGRSGLASVELGNRRLSIIDVAGGRQPISNEDGTIWTVLNGEIYNFQELRAELEARGHRFATRTDTEAIVHLYEEEGERCIERLEGMFALAVWDEPRQRLVLARDRLGKKPLLYAAIGRRVAFASEFQSLLEDPSISRELDPTGLDYYLRYGAIPAPWSIYQAIRKLPPAHRLVMERDGRTTIEPYWSLRYSPKLAISEGEAVERAAGLLSSAVRKRLISDVPLGVLLSGGVDSSAVVACMAQAASGPVKTFSIGFEESAYNELPHARRVAERFGCEHHELIVKPDAAQALPVLVRHFGEPFADSSAIPSFYLSRMARQHVTVALGGDGGDEVFAGYERHLANRLAEAWQRQPASLQRCARWLGRRLIAPAADARGLPAKLRRFLDAAALPRPARYESWVGLSSGQSPVAWRGPERGADGLIEACFEEAGQLDAVDAALAVDTRFYLPSDLLVKMDIASMANSLEVRSPLLDHHLVEFVARLPSRMKVRGLTLKYLLKRVVAQTLPSSTLQRPKRGFALPLAQWLRNGLRDVVGDHLTDSRIARAGLVDASSVTRVVQAHLHRRADRSRDVWMLLVLECWYRSFISR